MIIVVSLTTLTWKQFPCQLTSSNKLWKWHISLLFERVQLIYLQGCRAKWGIPQQCNLELIWDTCKACMQRRVVVGENVPLVSTLTWDSRACVAGLTKLFGLGKWGLSGGSGKFQHSSSSDSLRLNIIALRVLAKWRLRLGWLGWRTLTWLGQERWWGTDWEAWLKASSTTTLF